jgi:cobalt-zinc-cadmium efflux system protein
MAHHHTVNHSHTCSHADHGHSHANAGGTAGSGNAFFVAVFLNTAFVIAEFAFGFTANSTALMADAGHNLSDVFGLLLAWGAAILARRAPSGRFTYGLRATSILASLANAMFLLVACGGIGWEALQRFDHAPVVNGLTVTLVAALGIVINGLSAWLFVKGSKGDLNIRGAYLHMLADAAVSLGVVIAGAAMMLTGWNWLDPIVSLAIVAVIVAGTWGLLRESVHLVLDAIPAHIDAAGIDAYLRQLPGVGTIHDLHIWAMSTTENAMTVHLVMAEGYPGDAFMDEVTEILKMRFDLHHSTLQIEQGTTAHACCLAFEA